MKEATLAAERELTKCVRAVVIVLEAIPTKIESRVTTVGAVARVAVHRRNALVARRTRNCEIALFAGKRHGRYV